MSRCKNICLGSIPHKKIAESKISLKTGRTLLMVFLKAKTDVKRALNVVFEGNYHKNQLTQTIWIVIIAGRLNFARKRQTLLLVFLEPVNPVKRALIDVFDSSAVYSGGLIL